MEAKTQPCQGMLAALSAPRKLCRVCAVSFCYSPLHVYPDYCPTCIRSTSRVHLAASVDGRSLAPSPGGHLQGGDAVAEPLLSSNIAGAPSAKESGS